MNQCRSRLLIAIQLCLPVLSALFVAALGVLEASIAMLWLQAICSKANSSKIDQPVAPANKYSQGTPCSFDINFMSSLVEEYRIQIRQGGSRLNG